MKTKLGEGSTPGPWHIIGMWIDAAQDKNIDSDGERNSIAQTFGPDAHANANLIAKAPLLIEAREVLAAILDGGNIDCGAYWKIDIDDINKARALLAKLDAE